jgi:superfamily II DNA or RNA helicase
MPELWPHQMQGVKDVLAAHLAGRRRVCLTSPTGGGKTRMEEELIRGWLADGHRIVLYTNRRMLIDQTSRVLHEAGLSHGVRAAGYESNLGASLQISSVQTEVARVFKRQRWPLHAATRVLVDEGHLHVNATGKKLLNAHLEQGASYVMVTATPLGMGELCDHLIVAGTNSELRKCGALVRADHFAPDEPDMRQFKKLRLGLDLSENQLRKAMMTPSLMGRVWTWFEKLNPGHRPTILFACGVPESVWFAEQFTQKGVTAAHIDGEDIWVDGKFYNSDRQARADVLARSQAGEIHVICNRFVLREGIDAPWLVHGILATIYGSLQSYLQSGGRLLRAYPGLDHVTIQDHGGNWHRHGSLNADREWFLEHTAEIVAAVRDQRLRMRKCQRCRADLQRNSCWCPSCHFWNEIEPQRCPECARVIQGPRCSCGWEARGAKRSRPVVATDDRLVEMHGDIYRPHRISRQPDGKERWRKMYYRSRTERGAKTFRQAAALYAHENGSYPDPTWPLMPIEQHDWFKLVADVPRERLVPEPPHLTVPQIGSGGEAAYPLFNP